MPISVAFCTVVVYFKIEVASAVLQIRSFVYMTYIHQTALKLSCVGRVTSESFSCFHLLTASCNFSLICGGLTMLYDRQSVKHQNFLHLLKALFFAVKIK